MDSNLTEVSSFQDLFPKLINKIKEKGKVNDVSSHFTPSHSLEHMFSYLWNLDEAHSCLTPGTVVSDKSDAESEKLRMEGNNYYKKKLLEKALRSYNQSIMYASHPVFLFGKQNVEERAEGLQMISASGSDVYFETDTSEIVYEPLALGFANRSAVLLELKEYDKCLQDIEIAIGCGYPRVLHCKLLERKAKCLIAQKKKTEALQVIETALDTLSSLPLDETKRKSSQEALEKLYNLCQTQSLEDSLNISTCKSGCSSSSAKGYLQKYKTPRPPLLLDPSASIPSLSSTVQLAFSPTQGRYLVAEKDVEPGDVLVVEEGYSRVVHLDSHLKTHCSGCLARCHVPLPCPYCSLVIFCSKACQERALASYHGQECSTLAILAALDIGKNAVLAYRILMQTTFLRLKELVPVFQEEVLSIPAEKLGFSSNGIYDSSDYRSIFHLVTNKESRSVSDLFKRCAMAFILLKLLEKSHKFFVNADGAVFMPSQEDILLSGITLFTHMMNLPCNAHSINELEIDENCYQQSSSQEIGCGAFGVLSLTNHSCNPAAARISYGSVVVLKAIRHIPAGTEITDSYGEHYAVHPAETRQAALLHQYFFTCKCDPCRSVWPTYTDLPSRLVLKCTSCCSPVNFSKEVCPKCNKRYIDKDAMDLHLLNGKHDLRDVQEQIRQAMMKYEETYNEILKGNNSLENRNTLCQIIQLLDKFVMLPCKTYFEAQETLKHCFDRLGSYCIVNP